MGKEFREFPRFSVYSYGESIRYSVIKVHGYLGLSWKCTFVFPLSVFIEYIAVILVLQIG